MPSIAITARAETTTAAATRLLTQSITNSFTTFTTTIVLGRPTEIPPQVTGTWTSSPGPSRSTVIGAVVGSVIGFFIILLLIVCYATRWTSSRWGNWPTPPPSYTTSSRSSRSSRDSSRNRVRPPSIEVIFVSNANSVPTKATTPLTEAKLEKAFEKKTQVEKDNVNQNFKFVKPKGANKGKKVFKG